MTGEWEITHHDDPPDEEPYVNERACALDGRMVGWVEDAEARPRWEPYTTIIGTPALIGEQETVLCDDCYSWLELVAPAVVARSREPLPPA